MRRATQHLLLCTLAVLAVPGRSQLLPDPVQVLPDRAEVLWKRLTYLGAETLQPVRHLAARAIGKTQAVFRGDFPCPDAARFRAATPPRSVHRLMPGDVDVVAALGDSLTAGMGGSGFTQVGSLVEDRGLAWSIGGQDTWRETLTLPNILRQFNPRLLGFSTGTGPVASKQAGLNVGEPGALSRQLLWMARTLVRRIRADKRVNFKKHWKVVTLMIGNNDVCSEMCYLEDPAEIVEQHRQGLSETLRYFRDNLPRTLVNVVAISKLEELPDQTLPRSCFVPHRIFCPCLFGPRFQQNRARFSSITDALQQATVDVVHGSELDTEDFAVVLQPFTLELELPTMRGEDGGTVADVSYLAPDCFHFSQSGYARAANALWNNMLEPEGSKSEDWHRTMSRFVCPSPQHPFIFTRRNSRGSQLVLRLRDQDVREHRLAT